MAPKSVVDGVRRGAPAAVDGGGMISILCIESMSMERIEHAL